MESVESSFRVCKIVNIGVTSFCIAIKVSLSEVSKRV